MFLIPGIFASEMFHWCFDVYFAMLARSNYPNKPFKSIQRLNGFPVLFKSYAESMQLQKHENLASH